MQMRAFTAQRPPVHAMLVLVNLIGIAGRESCGHSKMPLFCAVERRHSALRTIIEVDQTKQSLKRYMRRLDAVLRDCLPSRYSRVADHITYSVALWTL